MKSVRTFVVHDCVSGRDVKQSFELRKKYSNSNLFFDRSKVDFQIPAGLNSATVIQKSPFAMVGGASVKLASAIHKVVKYYCRPKQSLNTIQKFKFGEKRI